MVVDAVKIVETYNQLKEYVKNNPNNTEIKKIFDDMGNAIAYTASGTNYFINF